MAGAADDLLGNVLVLVPMLLNAHAGTKYGVPFPVFVRVSFGVRGANFAAMARALVACGWFGIQTWIGGLALDALMQAGWSGWENVPGHSFITFLVFWAMQLVIILRGIEGVKIFEALAAPLLLAGSLVLLIWGFGVGHRQCVRDLGEAPTGRSSVLDALLALPRRECRVLDHALPQHPRLHPLRQDPAIADRRAGPGLPLTMTAFSFIGIAVTAATIVVFGEAIWDPVVLVTKLAQNAPLLLIVAMIIIAIAQISTNMAANVVSPSFDFSNLAPKYISFRTGGIITALIGIFSFPWVLFNNVGAYIFTWLVGYGSLLGAIAAVMIADYWILRRRQLDLAELYKLDGRYSYSNGWNWRAIAAVFIGVVPVLPGFFKAATTPGSLACSRTLRLSRASTTTACSSPSASPPSRTWRSP